jgi:sialate O-acetylesterase
MDYPHTDIHPMVKRVIAERALRWARAEVYHEQGLTWGSPALESFKREGSQMILTFTTSANEALLVKGEPSGLVIAGSDGKFVEAKAKVINRTSLAVWSEKVPEPTMVRYAWSQRAICRLFSASGLPVGPFRTDDGEIPLSEIRD